MSPKQVQQLAITWLKKNPPRNNRGQMRGVINTWMNSYKGPEKFIDVLVKYNNVSCFSA